VSVGWASAPALVAERAGAIYRDLRPHNRPAWTDLTSAGPWTLNPGDRFDRHYHDCDEYWLIAGGGALVEVEPEQVAVRPGDMLCIERGRAHTVVELYAPLEAFWVEGPVAPGGQVGSLHRSEEDAHGREVPLAADPAGSPNDGGSANDRPSFAWRAPGGNGRPRWSDLAGAGLATLGPAQPPPRRSRGSDEYWLIVDGSARLRLDGQVQGVGRGDVVCFERAAGREVVESAGPMRYFWLERRRA
jgi:mannose-6-phosphate isomerase-like protein (cupin superfamily)